MLRASSSDSTPSYTLGYYKSLPTMHATSSLNRTFSTVPAAWSRAPLGAPASLPAIPDDRPSRLPARIHDDLDVLALISRDPEAARELLLEKPFWGLGLNDEFFNSLFFGAAANPGLAKLSDGDRQRYDSQLRLLLIDKFPHHWQMLAMGTTEPAVWRYALEYARHAPAQEFERKAIMSFPEVYADAVCANPDLASAQTLRLAYELGNNQVMLAAWRHIEARADALRAAREASIQNLLSQSSGPYETYRS